MDIYLHHRLLKGLRMKHPSQPIMVPSKGEHGTIQSYIIGFLLSLVFTAIPYYLVVSKSVSGTALLATIVGFAVLQMVIQVVFFLHLGRGPKPLYNVVFFIFTVGLIVVVVGGSLFIMNNLYDNMSSVDVTKRLAQDESIYQIEGEQTGACKAVHANHKIRLSNGKASPLHTEAHLCDALTFINEDEIMREVTFGTHPQHGSYAGHFELPVRKRRGNTITLNQVGTYQFHDHLDPAISGVFAVRP